MRFLADMGVSRRVVEWLRERGHDVWHLREHGQQRLPDAEIFRLAEEERRIVLTFDLDFSEIAAFSRGSTSVIVFRLANARADNVRASPGESGSSSSEASVPGRSEPMLG